LNTEKQKEAKRRYRLKHRERLLLQDRLAKRAKRAADPAADAERQREWRAVNKSKVQAYNRKHYMNNAPVRIMQEKQRQLAHPAYYRSLLAARQARRRSARCLCAWADKFVMEEMHDLALRRTAATGVDWVVDHVVPLRADLVSGLHNEHNLQVIPASWNTTKSNLFWPGMP